ncbi:MAG: PIN domain-containing protein [Acidobacteria bacterium]|nr:MAG: PIN domain-containing protein [Acidobacteriota bacterium]
MPLLMDTGVLYALADADDAWHAPVLDCLGALKENLLVPVTVIPEVTYLLRSRLGRDAELSFVQSIVAGELDIEQLTQPDLSRTVDLLTRYGDIGFVDATVAAIAERLRLSVIATTDRRHFSQIQPSHRDSFELLP